MSQATDVLETLWAFQRVAESTLDPKDKVAIIADLHAGLPTEMLCTQAKETRLIVELKLKQGIEYYGRLIAPENSTEASVPTPTGPEPSGTLHKAVEGPGVASNEDSSNKVRPQSHRSKTGRS